MQKDRAHALMGGMGWVAPKSAKLSVKPTLNAGKLLGAVTF